MNGIIDKLASVFVKFNSMKRGHKVVTGMAALVVFVTTYLLILPALTLEKTNPSLSAEQMQGAVGDALTLSVSAEADSTQEEQVFLLSALGENAGLDDGYEFDEYGITTLVDDNGNAIDLHRDLQEDGTLDYWFTLSAGESTQFSLLLSNGTSQLVEQTALETEEEDPSEPEETAGEPSEEESEEDDVEQANQAAEPCPMQFTYADGDKSIAGSLKFYAASAATLEQARGSVTRKPDADLEFVWSEQVAAEETEEEEVTAEPQEESAQTEETEPAGREKETLESKVITASGDSYTISVAYAGIPEGATLEVSELTEGTEEYNEYLEQTADAINSEVEKLNYIKLLDISIMKDGEKVIPDAPVDVQIRLLDKEQAEESTQVVHFGEENTEIMNTAVEGDTVSFETKGFSVYAIVGTETITTEFLSHNGTKYEITVTYGPEANIPEGSTLSVTDIEEGTEEYEYARNAVLADKKEKGEEVLLSEFGFAALDISILNPEGKEIEPEAPVQVDFKIKSLPEVENLNDVVDSLEIQHHVETGDKVVVDTVYNGGSADASFDVATNEEVIAEGTAIDPSAFDETELSAAFEDTGEFETSFEVDVFSTYSISFYYGYRSRNVHYVDTNGNRLTPTMTPDFNARYQYLIYDIEGYEYDSTHIGSRTGTSIQPILRASSNNGLNSSENLQYTTGSTNYQGNLQWSNVGNNQDIYVVYKAKTSPTAGGTVTPTTDEEWPTGNDAPQFSKSSTNNGNGTNTISLSITAAEKEIENATKANVIVVFDVSGSMSDDLNGQTRLARAKTAVNSMANILLNKKDSKGNNLVKMGLVSFSTTANTVVPLTDAAATNLSTYQQRVNGLTADGGTNWEQALQMANRMAVDADAATFIVFVTDGDPTFRVSRGNYADNAIDLYTNGTYTYYRGNNVFGAGNGTLSQNNNTRNFNAAVTEAASIINSNKNFYAIGVSSEVTSVQNLVTQAGGSAGNAFLATNSTALTEAFDSIVSAISASLGFGNVEVTDGITALTNAEMKVMQTVDPNSFKYYRYGGKATDGTNTKYGADYDHKTEWTSRASDGCEAAGYNSTKGAVEWNMGESFQLEDGVTYVVEFTVWPSQAAYDLVADLNNGIRTYASLTDAEKAQIVEVTAPTSTTTGTYALKTNTNKVSATYNKTTKSGDVVSISDNTELTATYHEGNLQNMSLDSDYITIVKEWNNELDGRVASGVDLAITKDGTDYLTGITVNSDNNWTSGKQYVSAGVITKTSDGRYNVRETGHDYTVTEPASFSYYWDLTAAIYRPMVIDGTLHVLIKTDSPTGTEGTDYFVISGNNYQVRDGENTLTATNDRRSFLNLTKTVTKEEGAVDIPDPDAVFTYSITVTDVAGADVWFSAQDKDGATMVLPSTSNNVVAEMRDGALTGYYYVPSGQSFTIGLKADWNVRFINLPTGTTYSIQETGKGEDDGFQFVNAVATADNGGTAGTVNDDTVTGTIDKPNNDFTVTYTNKWLTKQIQIIKVDENDEMLADATFTLTKRSENVTTFTSKSTEGETISLGKGTYCLTETSAPDGYVILTNKIHFDVNADGTVALSDEDGETEGVTYDNASVSNPPTTTLGTVTVKNTPGTALPMTGGSGTLPYTLGGGLLMLGSGLLYSFLRKRERERRFWQ